MNEIKRRDKKERKKAIPSNDQLKLTHMLNKVMTKPVDDDDD
jgi:hypothetical protein